MASDFQLIVDDNSADFEFSGPGWKTNYHDQWYGGTCRSSSSENVSSSPSGSFTFSFEGEHWGPSYCCNLPTSLLGRSVAFYGTTPAPPACQNMTISIDGGHPYQTDYNSPNPPPSYQRWYQSPDLADGKHTITVSLTDGTSIDYAVINPSRDTSLTGKSVIVDDDSAMIDYNGRWSRNIGDFGPGTKTGGSPFRNGTHRSWTPGEGFTFKFTGKILTTFCCRAHSHDLLGTSIAIYGIFSWATLGVLSANYTLDGSTTSQSYSVTRNKPEYVNNAGEVSNFLLYSGNALPIGEHTLIANITQCTNLSFILDYLTFTPSFSSFSLMPSVTTSTTKPTSTLTGGKADNPLTSSTSKIEPPEDRLSLVPIIVGVVGGLTFLALIGFTVLFIRRRRKRYTKGRRADSYDCKSNHLTCVSRLPLTCF